MLIIICFVKLRPIISRHATLRIANILFGSAAAIEFNYNI